MYKLNKISGFVAMPVIIGSAILAVGVLGGLAYEYKNNQSVLSSVNKNNLLAQAYGGTTPTISILSPNGGESLQIGSQYTISISGMDANSPMFGIYLFKGGVQNLNKLGSIEGDGVVQYSSGYKDGFIWNIGKYGTYDAEGTQTASPGSDYYICLVTNSGILDCSNAPFTISSVPAPTIKVLSPNGGETFQQGQTYSISWQTNESSAPIGIYLSGFDEFGGTYIVGTILGKGGAVLILLMVKIIIIGKFQLPP